MIEEKQEAAVRDEKLLPAEIDYKPSIEIVTSDDGDVELRVKNYEAAKASLQKTLDAYPEFIVLDENDKKYAKKVRALFNNLSKGVNAKKIAATKTMCGNFETEMKALVDMIDKKSKAFDKAVKDYDTEVARKAQEASEVVVGSTVKAQRYVVTVTTTDPEVAKEIQKFAIEHNCEVKVTN